MKRVMVVPRDFEAFDGLGLSMVDYVIYCNNSANPVISSLLKTASSIYYTSVLSLPTRAHDKALQFHHLGRWPLLCFSPTNGLQEGFRRLRSSPDRYAEPSSRPLSQTG
jgi:hypothetical protein